MPLTTSHPAAVIPLTRLNLDLSALVISSMAPDFVYFIPFCLPLSDYSHTITGVLFLSLPLGLAALSIFHYLIKYPTLALLPGSHQSRLIGVTTRYTFFPLSRFLKITASVLAGAFTHIAWDSFTHLDGWVVNRFVILKTTLFAFGDSTVTIYKIFQHGSTVAGIVLLVYWYSVWYKKTKPATIPKKFMMSNRMKIAILSGMIFIAGSISSFFAFTSVDFFQTSLDHPDFFRIGYIMLVASFAVELVLFGIYWKIRMRIQNLVMGE